MLVTQSLLSILVQVLVWLTMDLAGPWDCQGLHEQHEALVIAMSMQTRPPTLGLPPLLRHTCLRGQEHEHRLLAVPHDSILR